MNDLGIGGLLLRKGLLESASLSSPAQTSTYQVRRCAQTPEHACTTHPPTNTHAHSIPHLSHLNTLMTTASWAAPFVDFSWNVSFHWGPGIRAFVVDGEAHGCEPQNSMSSQNPPCACTSPYSYLLAGLAHLLGFPFRDAHLAFSWYVSLARKGGKTWRATGLR